MGTEDPPDDVDAISSLGEASRRALYDHVARADGWVSRDEAAEATGLERATAARHLDRLADDGLLEVAFRRLTGRSGPGAGRPAKLYRRAEREIAVSLPPRDYELVGRLLAAAADRSRTEAVEITEALEAEARRAGRRLAAEIDDRLSGVDARRGEVRRRAVLDVLADHGFEPGPGDDDTVVLRNCPFHRLAREHTELICGMNHCLLDEAVEGVGRTGLHAELEPEEGHCCVKLHRRPGVGQARFDDRG